MPKTKAKYILIGLLGVALIGMAGAGFWYIVLEQKEPALGHAVAAAQQPSPTGQTLGASSGSDSIPLTPTPSQGADDSGLHVSQDNSSAGNLGQLTPNTNSQSGSSSSSASKTSPFDPSTFAQYDKYKDGTSAMFGDVQVGTGDELTAGKKAAVYYKGWLTNGQLFDASRTDDKGQLQPFILTLGSHQVIPGWEQGLAGMKVGGTRLIIVPPAVGYGPLGQGAVPGNAVLVFQVQLAAVQ